MRVLDEKGQNIGVMPLEAALKLAAEKGDDLIEVVPTAKPPVAKIISFDKFRYQKEKEFKKQKAGQKVSELKRIQISVKAAKNDLEIKIKKLKEFLEDGDKVEILLVLRGREKYNRDWARLKLEEFLKMIDVEYKITMAPKFGGKGMIAQIVSK
ncbi:translation initiation factor IF-3 [Candidatus Wolfebacteria bacterium]|nr:translation initiation factor IF-3 [Candidatus Wolfebacteria bacterium]